MLACDLEHFTWAYPLPSSQSLAGSDSGLLQAVDVDDPAGDSNPSLLAIPLSLNGWYIVCIHNDVEGTTDAPCVSGFDAQ
jgi:hypothetical protein